MQSIQLFALRTPKIVDWGDNIEEMFFDALEYEKFSLVDGDIVVITSKIYSMMQKSAIKLSTIKPSQQAIELSKESKLDPRVVQLVIDESNGKVFGSVFHAILAKTPYGLSANAGIDLSNSPEGYALLLPTNPDQEAMTFKNAIKEKLNIDVAVLIIDSRTMPLRRGTTAIALGIAGMEPIIDEIGKEDLYGSKLEITTRALADNVATAVNIIMGETNERMPFGIARGIKYEKSNQVSMQSTLMPENQCLYFAPLMKLHNKGANHEV